MFYEYVKYFFTGYKTDSMSAGILAFLAAVRNTLLTVLAIIFVNVYDAISKGTFDLWNWAAWQAYLLPAFMFLLSLINEWFRKHAYPAVSISSLALRQPVTPQGSLPSVSIRQNPMPPPE